MGPKKGAAKKGPEVEEEDPNAARAGPGRLRFRFEGRVPVWEGGRGRVGLGTAEVEGVDEGGGGGGGAGEGGSEGEGEARESAVPATGDVTCPTLGTLAVALGSWFSSPEELPELAWSEGSGEVDLEWGAAWDGLEGTIDFVATEKVVRSMCAKAGHVELTVRSMGGAEGEREGFVSVSLAKLLMGKRVTTERIELPWGMGEMSVTVEAEARDWKDGEAPPPPVVPLSSSGGVDVPGDVASQAEPLHNGLLMPDLMLRKLNPLLLRVRSASRLPSQPATPEYLDSDCLAPFLNYRFFDLDGGSGATRATCLATTAWEGAEEGDDSAVGFDGQPLAGRGPGFGKVRNALFEHERIVVTGDIAPAVLRERLQTGFFEVEVHDRAPKKAPQAMPSVVEAFRAAKVAADAAATPMVVLAGEEGVAEGGVESKHDATTIAEENGKGGDAEASPAEDRHYGIARLNLFDVTQRPFGAVHKFKAALVPAYPALSRSGPKDPKDVMQKTPAQYKQADSYVTLTAQLALPLPEVPPEARPPFLRTIFVLEYRDRDILLPLRRLIRSHNAAVLEVQGDEELVIATLSTIDLTPDQVLDASLDVLTGFHVVGGKGSRVIVVEGLADGGGMREVIRLAHDFQLRRSTSDDENATPPRRGLFYNTEIRFTRAIYRKLGPELMDLKLGKSIETVSGSAQVAVRGRVAPEVARCLAKLARLLGVRWFRETVLLDLFPTVAELLQTDRRFAAPLVLPDDTEGPIPQPPPVRVVSPDPLADAVPAQFMRGHGPPRNPHVDRDPSAVDRERAEREALRKATNYGALNKQQLIEVGRRQKESHPRQHKKVVLVDPLGETALARRLRIEAENALVLEKERGFKWPAVPEPKYFKEHPLKPSAQRVEELQEPWLGPPAEAMKKSGMRSFALGPGVPDFRVDTDPNSNVFEKDAKFFESIFIHDMEGELAELKAREKTEWKSKVIVDDVVFRPYLAATSRLRPGDLDKRHGILKDRPSRGTITALGRNAIVKNAPISMFNVGQPYQDPGSATAKLFRPDHPEKWTTGKGKALGGDFTKYVKAQTPFAETRKCKPVDNALKVRRPDLFKV